MTTLGSAPNVYDTCLRLLRKRGYSLCVKKTRAEGYPMWIAEKDGFKFVGDNPIELLGLTAIYEEVLPVDAASAPSYWWRIEGDNISGELIDAAPAYQPIEDNDQGYLVI